MRTNSKVKAFKKIFGRETKSKYALTIARVSDLIEKGFDADMLANEFIRINKEVWGNITGSQYIWTKEMLKSQFQICSHLLYCTFENGKIVATASGIFVTEEDFKNISPGLRKLIADFIPLINHMEILHLGQTYQSFRRHQKKLQTI